MKLSIEKLCKSFVKNKKKIDIFKDLSIDFSSKEIYLIKGKSGAGKTTLLSLIALLDNCDSGQIMFNDKDITKLSNKERANYRYDNLGFVFQEYNLFSSLTVEENILLAFGEEKITNKEINKIHQILEDIGLSSRKDHKASELSGGEKQRVAFARAFVKKPLILICDEPVSNLDDENTLEIKNILKNYVDNNECICIVTCHTGVFDDIATKNILLKDGTVLLEGKVISSECQ